MENTEFELTDRATLSTLWRLEGMLKIREAIEQAGGTLPGARLALAVCDVQLNEARVDYTQRLFRAVAKEGIDASKAKMVRTDQRGSKTFIVCEPYDLADLAEQEG